MDIVKKGFITYIILSCVLFIIILASPLTSIGDKLLASIIMFNLITIGFMIVHLKEIMVKQ